MTEGFFSHKISISQIIVDSTNTGELILKSNETIQIDRILAYIFLEKRGRLSSSKTNQITFRISNEMVLEKDKEYSFPFSFDFPATELETYNGSNVSFAYVSEFHIDVCEGDKDKLDRGLFTKMKSFISSEDSVIISKYLTLENKNRGYSIVEQKSELKFHPNPKLIIGIVVAVFIALYFYLDEFPIWYFFLAFGLFVVLVVIIPKIIKQFMGNVSIETFKKDHAILFKIAKARKFELSNQKLYYEIVEKVIDNRGTKSSTSTETIFTSSHKSISEFRQGNEVEFEYPKKRGLYSLSTEDVYLTWHIILEGKQLGIPLKFKSEFKVNRDRQAL